jgi:hypothetical protein
MSDIALTTTGRQLWMSSMRTAETGRAVFRFRAVTGPTARMAGVVALLIILTAFLTGTMAVCARLIQFNILPVLTSRQISWKNLNSGLNKAGTQ